MSLLFALWFASGAVMLFVPFPSLPEVERLQFSPSIEPTLLEVEPARAIAVAVDQNSLEQVDSLRVIGRQNKAPLYVIAGTTEGAFAQAVINASTGEVEPAVDSKGAQQIATEFEQAVGFQRAGAFQQAGGFGETAEAKVRGPFDYDQWVVHHNFDPYRPFFEVRLGDEAGTVLYVTSAAGEVRQRTNKKQRFWNWLGSVPHWIYFTGIRRDWGLWDSLVWWISLVGVAVAGLGAFVGIMRVRNLGSSRGWTRFSPFRGWMRWHHLLGLSGGVFLLTWMVSGWLSMDHGRLFSESAPEGERANHYLGGSLADAASGLLVSDLRSVLPASELVVHRFDGAAVVLAHSGKDRRVYFLDRSLPEPGRLLKRRPTEEQIRRQLKRAWPQSRAQKARFIEPDDLYGHLLEGPLPEVAVRFELEDQAGTWVHIDGESGQILSVVNRSRRIYRWLYNGLHSFDLPYLAQRPSLRKTIMLFWLLIGWSLSITSVVIGARRLKIWFGKSAGVEA